MNWFRRALIAENKAPFPMFGQYIGNKAPLLNHIDNAMATAGLDMQNGVKSVLDLFAGGGAFSRNMIRQNKQVISNDALHSSTLYNDVYSPLTQKELDIALANTEQPLPTITPEQEQENPSLLSHLLYQDEVHFVNTYTANIQKLQPERKNLMAMLLNLFLRARRSARPYLNQMLSRKDMRRERGQRITKAEFMKYLSSADTQKKLQSYYGHSSTKPEIHNKQAPQLLSELKQQKRQVDLVYLDPPYAGDQSDYGRMNTVFEDIAQGQPQRTQLNDFRKSTKQQNVPEYMKFLSGILQQSGTVGKNVVLSINDRTVAAICKQVGITPEQVPEWMKRLTGKKNIASFYMEKAQAIGRPAIEYTFIMGKDIIPTKGYVQA
jgi:adenine-specific DNA methylase